LIENSHTKARTIQNDDRQTKIGELKNRRDKNCHRVKAARALLQSERGRRCRVTGLQEKHRGGGEDQATLLHSIRRRTRPSASSSSSSKRIAHDKVSPINKNESERGLAQKK